PIEAMATGVAFKFVDGHGYSVVSGRLAVGTNALSVCSGRFQCSAARSVPTGAGPRDGSARQGHRGSRGCLCGHGHWLPKAGEPGGRVGTDGNRLGVNVSGIVLLVSTLPDGGPGTSRHGSSPKHATMRVAERMPAAHDVPSTGCTPRKNPPWR